MNADTAIVSPLVWSDKAPTEPGWWWLERYEFGKIKAATVPVSCQRSYGDWLCVLIDGHWKPIDDLLENEICRWSGPIPLPQNL